MAKEEKTPVLESNIFKFTRPGITVDVVLFAIINNELKVGLIKRQEEPYFGKHALPGRFVRYEEKIEDTARKALEAKGNIDASKIHLEQLYTFGQELKRDTRIRTITIVYYALIDAEEILRQNGNKFLWESVYNLPSLSFDHKDIILFALDSLREKIAVSDFARKLMPEKFTLTKLQETYEIILHKKQDKRNFRKKMLSLGILKETKEITTDVSHRPARIYSFKKMEGK